MVTEDMYSIYTSHNSRTVCRFVLPAFAVDKYTLTLIIEEEVKQSQSVNVSNVNDAHALGLQGNAVVGIPASSTACAAILLL